MSSMPQDSRTKPGHGLGLNLVSAVARLHGGRLRFRDAAPGLSAILELRTAGSPPANLPNPITKETLNG